MCVGQIQLAKNQPVLQKTKLGWIIADPAAVSNRIDNQGQPCLISLELGQQIEKFWQIEEINNKQYFTQEEMLCEEHFTKAKQRDDGRYTVSLPKKANVQLGESLEILFLYYAV